MLKIAVVDDNETFLREMKRTVEACDEFTEDMACDIYSSGEAFLQAGNGAYQLVILDMQMEGRSGYETACRLRETDDLAVIAFISGVILPEPEHFRVQPYRYLLKDSDPEQRCRDMEELVTPLALACRHGNVEIARMLLEAGADETVKDVKGNPPVFSLLRYPHRFTAEARINDPIYDRKCEILAMLKEIEATDAEGYTVLMRSMQDSPDWADPASAYSNNLPITLALIQRGANLEAAGNDGKRPLHLAVTALGDVEKKLVKAGASLNIQDNEGNTPLLIACRKSNEKVVRYLIKSGADISLQNNAGETAMDLCSERGFTDALQLMMEQ